MRKRGVFLVVPLIFVLIILNSISATNYYVNASKPCTGDGTSEANAWCSVANVSGASFNPGDNIYFARGEEWREQLTIPNSGNSTHQITFSAYGTGDKPIINGADLITSGSSWSQTSLWKTVFNVSLSGDLGSGARNYRNIIPANTSNYSGTKIQQVVDLLKDSKEIEVRIRKME